MENKKADEQSKNHVEDLKDENAPKNERHSQTPEQEASKSHRPRGHKMHREAFEQSVKDALNEAKETIDDAKATVKEASTKATSEGGAKLAKVYAELEAKVKRLQTKITDLEREKAAELRAFQDKAENFQAKAQVEINKFRDALVAKFEREGSEKNKYVIQKLVEDLADPLLNFDLAIASGSNQEGPTSAYVQGFKMLLDQVNNALAEHGVKMIEPKVNTLYDSHLHYAIGREVNDEKPADTILSVRKKGYQLHERVIKPAVVVISVKSN